MRCYHKRHYLPVLLLAGCIAQIAPASALADSSRGVLHVSVTVLPSCEVNTVKAGFSNVPGDLTEQSANIAVVLCQADYPIRVSLNGSGRLVLESSHDAQAAGRGALRVNLSRLPVENEKNVEGGELMLTIAY